MLHPCLASPSAVCYVTPAVRDSLNIIDLESWTEAVEQIGRKS